MNPYTLGLVVVALFGVAAGYFFAAGPLIILSVIGVMLFLLGYKAANDGPPGTSGGIGVFFLIIVPVACFLVPMWVTALIVHIDFAGMFSSISMESVRQFFFR